MNLRNRDKPSSEMVDATKMPLDYIATMIADWLAVSEEKNTNVRDWLKMNANVRWKFIEKQINLMEKILDTLGY